ncbi:MAG: hypothetical protein Q7U57_05190 [Methylovulum sp.]|nr:hypothetical protein [Methylovulum sp.]
MKNNKTSLLALAGLMAALILPTVPFNAAAADTGNACRALISGTYLATISNPDGSFASRAVLTFNSDGNLSSADSNQGGMAGGFNAFTTSLGSWHCEDRRTLHGTVINFSLPGVASAEGGIARSDYQASFNVRKQTIQGTIDVRFFGLTDDPYQVDLPAPAISVTFEGGRVPAQ